MFAFYVMCGCLCFNIPLFFSVFWFLAHQQKPKDSDSTIGSFVSGFLLYILECLAIYDNVVLKFLRTSGNFSEFRVVRLLQPLSKFVDYYKFQTSQYLIFKEVSKPSCIFKNIKVLKLPRIQDFKNVQPH